MGAAAPCLKSTSNQYRAQSPVPLCAQHCHCNLQVNNIPELAFTFQDTSSKETKTVDNIKKYKAEIKQILAELWRPTELLALCQKLYGRRLELVHPTTSGGRCTNKAACLSTVQNYLLSHLVSFVHRASCPEISCHLYVVQAVLKSVHEIICTSCKLS